MYENLHVSWHSPASDDHWIYLYLCSLSLASGWLSVWMPCESWYRPRLYSSLLQVPPASSVDHEMDG
eukprot:2709448-Pyramimonas_sp.AAC.1